MPDYILSSPSSLEMLQGSKITEQSPGFSLVQSPGNVSSSRLWRDVTRMSYRLRTAPMSPADLYLFELFVSRARARTFSFVEPNSRTHQDLLLGPAPDGTRTTFRAPICIGPGGTIPDPLVITKNGEILEETTHYTVHEVANLASESVALLDENYSSYVAIEGSGNSLSLQSQFSNSGEDCPRVTPAGTAQAAVRTKLAAGHSVQVEELEEYTTMAVMFEPISPARAYKVRASYHTAAQAFLGSSTASPADASSNGWKVFSHTATTVATTATITPYLIAQSSATTDDWFWTGFSVAPGDYDVWHLPSQAPMIIEFVSAPDEGDELRISCAGKRWTELSIDSPVEYSQDQSGRATVARITATENME